MGGRKKLFEHEHLVDGLTLHERVARLEHQLAGDKRAPGLLDDYEDIRRDVADMKAAANRQSIPWYLRLFVRGKVS